MCPCGRGWVTWLAGADNSMMSNATLPPADLAQTPTVRTWREALRLYLQPASLRMLALGFAAGLPLLLVLGTLSFRLREAGIDRSTIGYLSWVGLAYGVKWMWAPLVDRMPIPWLTRQLGRRRSWLLVSQLVISVGLVGMAMNDPSQLLGPLVACALAVAIASATQDIALDAYRIESAEANAQAALEEEKARGRVAEEEWRSFTDGKAPELGLRRPQLASALANVRSAEAELERARRDLSRTEIRAPYAGLVKSRAVDLGQFISRGTSVGVIYGTDVAEVRLPITDNDSAFIQLPDFTADEMKPEVMLTAVVAGEIVQWPAKLVRSEGVLDERSRVIYGVAQVNDPYQRNNPSKTPLRFGRFVQAEIMGDATSQVVVVPRHLLLAKQQILVVDSESQLQFRTVEVERADDRFAYIRSGFADGDRLATSAIANPLAGTLVRVSSDQVEQVADTPKTEDSAVLTSQAKE